MSASSTRTSETVRERVRSSYRLRLSARLPTTFPCLSCWRRSFRRRGRLRTGPLWWPVVFGVNLGATLTLIGSASTLVAMTITHKNDLAISFGLFVKLAIPFAGLQIALAAVDVPLVLR